MFVGVSKLGMVLSTYLVVRYTHTYTHTHVEAKKGTLDEFSYMILHFFFWVWPLRSYIYLFFLEVEATRRFLICFGIFSFRFSAFASFAACLRCYIVTLVC